MLGVSENPGSNHVNLLNVAVEVSAGKILSPAQESLLKSRLQTSMKKAGIKLDNNTNYKATIHVDLNRKEGESESVDPKPRCVRISDSFGSHIELEKNKRIYNITDKKILSKEHYRYIDDLGIEDGGLGLAKDTLGNSPLKFNIGKVEKEIAHHEKYAGFLELDSTDKIEGLKGKIEAFKGLIKAEGVRIFKKLKVELKNEITKDWIALLEERKICEESKFINKIVDDRTQADYLMEKENSELRMEYEQMKADLEQNEA